MGLLITQPLFSSWYSVVTCYRGFLKTRNLEGAIWSVTRVHMQGWVEQYLVLGLSGAVEQEVGNISMEI